MPPMSIVTAGYASTGVMFIVITDKPSYSSFIIVVFIGDDLKT